MYNPIIATLMAGFLAWIVVGINHSDGSISTRDLSDTQYEKKSDCDKAARKLQAKLDPRETVAKLKCVKVSLRRD